VDEVSPQAAVRIVERAAQRAVNTWSESRRNRAVQDGTPLVAEVAPSPAKVPVRAMCQPSLTRKRPGVRVPQRLDVVGGSRSGDPLDHVDFVVPELDAEEAGVVRLENTVLSRLLSPPCAHDRQAHEADDGVGLPPARQDRRKTAGSAMTGKMSGVPTWSSSQSTIPVHDGGRQSALRADVDGIGYGPQHRVEVSHRTAQVLDHLVCTAGSCTSWGSAAQPANPRGSPGPSTGSRTGCSDRCCRTRTRTRDLSSRWAVPGCRQ